MNIVILCGGKGTRLESVSKGKPKILIPIEEKPFIYYLLDCLIKYGFRKIFLLIAYKSQSIMREIGDFYKGVPITYIKDNKELKAGTASALLNAIKILPKHFLLQYGDTILDIDYKDFYHKSSSLNNEMLMAIYSNENNLDKNNVLYKKNKLNYYNTELKSNYENIKIANFIDYGLLGFQKIFLEKHINFLRENESLKFFQEKMSQLNLIKPYMVKKRFYEIGTPESYYEFKNNYLKGYLKKIISY